MDATPIRQFIPRCAPAERIQAGPPEAARGVEREGIPSRLELAAAGS